MSDRQRFSEHRNNAERRKIAFEFSFESWVQWWFDTLGENWREMRGRTYGKYCMARRGDRGPYEIGNVKCILTASNVTDAAVNDTIAFGDRAGHVVLSVEAVKDIFISNDKMDVLASRYGVSVGTVNDIRSGRTWRRATKGMTRESLRGRNQWA